MEPVKRIGILTSGGDAPGMNAAIRAAVLTACHFEIESVGIRRGYNGLIAGDVLPLTRKDVEGMTNLGGTMLYTARSAEFYTKAGQKRAADNCRFLGLDALVVIGGDGSFHGALELQRLGVRVACVPGTIDNDIGCSTYTIGFDTACNTAIDAMDKLNDTMKSHERCSVVEVMGHKSGHIALNVGIATGATATLTPENEVDFEADVIARIREARLRGSTHFTVVVAEGAYSAHDAAERIQAETGIEARATTLGHIQRGGSPLTRDRVTAARMGYRAVTLLRDGESGKIVVMNGDVCETVDIEPGLAMKKSFDADMCKMQNVLMK
ncbi:MAG: 6-phosphofructokinase [Oscillospiraceae bacterium]|nr:6-phosphofructokinase [Oscillospiraceae bacterium]